MSSAPRKLRDDCFLTDSDRLSHAKALTTLRESIEPVVRVADVALRAAGGRTLAAPLVAVRSVPGHDNAAVDGYAFRFADYAAEAGSTFTIAGRAAAGHPFEGVLAAGEAVRILTGAVVPESLDSIVMQEDVTLAGAPREGDGDGEGGDGNGAPQTVFIPGGLRPGANVRPAGEDVAEGRTVAAAGQVLRPQELAAIASAGFGMLRCFERLRVAIISSGDEVLEPGAPFEPGKVYDANTVMLGDLVARAGGEAHALGILADDADAVRQALGRAAGDYHLILSSGGASQGDEDHLVDALSELGQRHLWQIAIKPGRPLSFGQIGDTVVLGLPGNPVAAFVCFLLYGLPLLRRLGGAEWPEPLAFDVPADFEIKSKKPGRREFLRATYHCDVTGPRLERFPRDGSGLISSLTMSNGLAEVPEDCTTIARGESVRFLPYAGFGIL